MKVVARTVSDTPATARATRKHRRGATLQFLPPSGYAVVFMRLADGRPVGVAIDGRGALPVADDAGNVIWRATAAR